MVIYEVTTRKGEDRGRFIFEISGLKSNGTGKVPGNFFENLGIRFVLVLVS